LFARRTKVRYLKETMSVSDQTTRERTPRTFSRVGATGCSPKKASRMA